MHVIFRRFKTIFCFPTHSHKKQ